MSNALLAPFPWFGGKSRVASLVWERFGDVPNYVEPFAGSLAVLLARPHDPKTETVNDLNGYLSNFWRTVKADPEGLCALMDYPVSERDLEARHYWLVTEGAKRLEAIKGEPDAFDAKVAAWWCWGLCAWIGSGWCTGEGPWVWDGGWSNLRGQGVARQLPALGDAGRGINRVDSPPFGELIRSLGNRLRGVRVCQGDWSRVTGPSVTVKHGTTGVFLDPPYSTEECQDVYGTGSVAADVRAWCLESGDNPEFRIALCGYAGEGHEALEEAGWTALGWKARGGYGSQGDGRGRDNAHRERIWFSPHCLQPEKTPTLFSILAEVS